MLLPPAGGATMSLAHSIMSFENTQNYKVTNIIHKLNYVNLTHNPTVLISAGDSSPNTTTRIPHLLLWWTKINELNMMEELHLLKQRNNFELLSFNGPKKKKLFSRIYNKNVLSKSWGSQEDPIYFGTSWHLQPWPYLICPPQPP